MKQAPYKVSALHGDGERSLPRPQILLTSNQDIYIGLYSGTLVWTNFWTLICNNRPVIGYVSLARRIITGARLESALHEFTEGLGGRHLLLLIYVY